MKTLTIFTPTYNRAYCLGDLYESLKGQTSKDFIWMIIDDGSTDQTKQVVEKWMSEGWVEINYYYKENGGMHTGYNIAYQKIDTLLNMCIDSDDICTSDAVELIISHWTKYGSDQYAGIFALDCLRSNNQIIGDRFPAGMTNTTVGDYYWTHKLKGDKKIIYRTNVVKLFGTYPVFKGERFVPIFCIPFMIDQEYSLLTLNEVVCVVEYRSDGSTLNIVESYFKNPKGFSYARKIRMLYSPSLADRFRNAIHYVSSSIIAKDLLFYHNSPKKLLTISAIFPGLVLNLYLRYLKAKRR